MNRIARALAAAAACLLAQQASAADFPAGPPPLRAPSAIIAAHWEGFYVGGHVGYAAIDGAYSVNEGIIDHYEIDTDGFAGGGQVGVQAQWGHWVAGVEGTLSWADLGETRNSAVAARTSTIDIRQIGTIVGRLGWAWNRWMIYGKGGFAYGRVHALYQDAVAFESKEWETGYTLGLGVEYLLLPNWSVGLEFDYYNLKFNRTMTSGATNAAIIDSGADIYAVMARANYLFLTRW